MTLKSQAEDFLAQKRIAVAGVSREEKSGTGNAIYRALRDRGYEVFPVNPHADEIEGAPCFHRMADIPGTVDGAVIITSPAVTEMVVRDCAEAGIKRVWMHNNTLLPSSVSDEAVTFCQENGIDVIAGACPMMFLDVGHKCLRWVLQTMGRLPQ